tara:strand:+ start:134 stop:394 length:261 start_codon:yes stop_codon:yes gene_type:complete
MEEDTGIPPKQRSSFVANNEEEVEEEVEERTPKTVASPSPKLIPLISTSVDSWYLLLLVAIGDIPFSGIYIVVDTDSVAPPPHLPP